jgi:hypothetical protein
MLKLLLGAMLDGLAVGTEALDLTELDSVAQKSRNLLRSPWAIDSKETPRSRTAMFLQAPGKDRVGLREEQTIMLDGVCWAVVRPLGMRRRHVAMAEGNLDEIAAGDGATTSIDPLIEAIERTIVTPGVAALARLQPDQMAWPIALAWLTRDQECRRNVSTIVRQPVW